MNSQSTFSKPVHFREAKVSIVEKLFTKTNNRDGCWVFNGSINKDGYGRFQFNKREVLAHRASYELMNGLIPPKMVIDHKCHNDSDCRNTKKDCLHRRCINPKHLNMVTMSDNNRTGRSTKVNSEKVVCKWGHSLDTSNVYIVTRTTSTGNISTSRKCKTCNHNSTVNRYWTRKLGL